MKRGTRSLFFILFFLVSISMPVSAFAQNHKGLTFQATVKDSGGTLINDTGLTVNVRVLSPNDCILLEENHAGVNITNGYLYLVIGKGTRAGADPAFTLKDVLSNYTARPGLTADAGGACTYTPAGDTQDARKLKVTFVTGAQTVAATLNIRGSAFAVDSETVGGKSAAEFIQTNTDVTQARVNALLAPNTYNNLVALDSGSTSAFELPSGTTAQRPAGTLGQIRFNSQTGNVEFYNGSAWTAMNALAVGTSSGTVAAGDDSRIVNAIQNAGFTPSIQAGADGTQPAATNSGKLFFATDTQKIYRDTGSWVIMGTGNYNDLTNKPTGNSLLPSQTGNSGKFLTTDGTNTSWAAAGETNTTSNVGIGGVGVFKQKTGVNFELKNINAASAKISVTNDAANNEIDLDVNQANLSIAWSQLTSVPTSQLAPAPASGDALKMLRVNAGETGYELRTPANVRSDISAAASGANSDITSMTAVTSVGSSGALTLSAGGSNTNVAVNPNGTGKVTVGGTNSVVNLKNVEFAGSTSGTMTMKGGATITDYTVTWPNAKATIAGQALTSDTSGNLSWTSVGTGDALTSGNLSQFASTTSAQLAGVLSDETGSGAAVFGTSPTITTPTFTTNITTPLIIGGTGTTSTLTYKTTTGVGAAGADHIFQVGNNGGTEAMRILNSGNVGIGTASPNEQLEITGNFRLPTSSSTVGQVKVGATRVFHAYGVDNLFFGDNSGNFTLTNGFNIGLGKNSLSALTSGQSNYAVGANALANLTTGQRNIAMGTQAGQTLTTGQDNIALGHSSLWGATTHSGNTAVGYASLFSSTGNYNTALGSQAMGGGTTGSYNVGLGRQALNGLTSGGFNVAVGTEAGYAPNNINANATTTGSNNVFIGHQSGADSATQVTNSIAIGYRATVATSNSMVLGGTGANAVNVGIGTTSPTVSLDVGSRTDAVRVPASTTANRPASPANGMIRYNTDNNKLESYINGGWQDLAGSATGGSFLSSSGGSLSGALTISSGGINNTGGFDNNSGGITEAGSITGVGANITGTGALSVAAGGTNTNLSLQPNGTGLVNIGDNLANYVTVKGATATNAPVIGTAGSDANINLMFSPKGTGNTTFSSGNVGIGVINPTNKLEVGDMAGAHNGYGLAVKNPTYGAYILTTGSTATDAALRVGSDSNSDLLRVQNNGSVGIGFSAPAYTLDISKNNASGYTASGATSVPFTVSDPVLRILNNQTTDDSAAYLALQVRDTALHNQVGYIGAVSQNNSFSPNIIFGARSATANYSEYMRISSSGNVGIGTSNPGQKLTVAGTIESTSGGIKFPDGTVQVTSAIGGVNNSMISNFPDAIRCSDGTNYLWLYLQYQTTTYIEYAVPADGTGGRMILSYLTNGNYNTNAGLTGYDCVTSTYSISQLVSLGRTYSFAKGPAAQWLSGASSSAYYNAGNVGIGTNTPAVSLDVGSKTDAIRVPASTTANRPASPANGMIRYNTDNNKLESYINGGWQDLSGGNYLSSSGGTLSGGLTVSSGGFNNTGGIDNNSGGITEAGSITGVGANITGTGAMTVAAGGTNTNLSLQPNGTGLVNIGDNLANYVTVKGATATNSPMIGTAGSDANINLLLTPKGTGNVAVSTGNFGIGTTNPGYPLEIWNGNTSSVKFTRFLASTLPVAYENVKSRGASLGANAKVVAGDSLSSFRANAIADDNSTVARAARYDVVVPTGGVPAAGTTVAGDHLWFTTNIAGTEAERMRLTSEGHLGVGTSTPNISGYNGGRMVMTVAGPNYGVLELANYQGDGQTTAGLIDFTMPSNTAGSRFSVAEIVGSATGTTANDRGGMLRFFTKPDGTTANQERIRIDSNGYVGIGATPTTKLEISGAHVSGKGLLYVDGTDHSYIMTNAPATGDAGFAIRNGGGAAGWLISRPANETYLNIYDQANTLNVMTFKPGGNVGIGTNAPSEKLHVGTGWALFDNNYGVRSKTTAGTISNMILSTASDNLIVGSGNWNNISFHTGVADRMYIAGSTGNVGIATASPTEKLEVNGNLKVTGNIISSNGAKTHTVTATGIATDQVYELMRISRDTVNWSFSGYEITARTSYYGGGGFVKAFISYGYNDSGTLKILETAGVFQPKISLGSEVVVSGTIKYTPVNIQVPAYHRFDIEVRHSATEVASITNYSEVQFTGTYTSTGATGTFHDGSISAFNVMSGKVGIGTLNPGVSLDLGSKTDAIALPAGTTAQQPASPVAGWLRYNSQNAVLEFHNGSAWQQIVGGGSAVNPAGIIGSFPTASCPSGWLEANGAAVSRTTYASLFTAIGTTYGTGDGSTTFNIPDYRGYFLRGWSHASGNDPDAASRTNRGDGVTGDNVGTKQTNQFLAHSHGVTDPGHSHSLGQYQGSTGGQYGLLDTGNSGSSGIAGTAGATTGISVNNAGGNETRPKNINVTYCISTATNSATTVASSGSGTTNYIPRWTSSTALGDSPVAVSGSNVGIGTASPAATLDVNGPVIRQVFYAHGNGPNQSAPGTSPYTVTGRSLNFTKYAAGTVLMVKWYDNLRTYGTTANPSCRWEIKIDGGSCGTPIDYHLYSNTGANQHRGVTTEGICTGIGAGAHTMTIQMTGGLPGHDPADDCYTGWNNQYWMMSVEEIR